jgi:hypothetical protein
MFRSLMLAGAVAAFSLQAAGYSAIAQQPTRAQRDAIRASCRSDFMANCSSVTPGGKEALECLLRNQAKLSAACKVAVTAVMPAKPAPAAFAPAETPSTPAAAKSEPAAPPAPAASEPAPKSAASQEAQLKSVRQACTLNDFMAHCSWIKPDNPELVLCLQANATDLSPSCQAAVQGAPPPAAHAPAVAPEKKPAAATPTKKPVAEHEPAMPSAPPAASAATTAAPTEAQKSAIRAACRSDFMANCSGVHPGGAEALQCLKSHAASLSSACQSAVAAIGGAAPAAGSASAPAASALTPAVAPLGPIPPMLPREALRILAMCRPEQESLCSGVPIGGGRILACLADHAQQLSLECYQALARAAR